uniref:tail fiber protein n=1 Tax=Campylobacter concisus TaxID=199 RepID=UPI0011E6A9A4
GKYNKIVEIIKTFDTLKAQIEEVLKNGTINDSAEALISTFSSKKIMDLLNEAKGVVDEKFSTIHKNGITPWNSTLEYPAGAISVLNGKLYQAKSQNTNKNPSENKEIWHVVANKEWCEQTFLNKNEKIDAYTKQESDDKFALKIELTDGLPIGAYLSYPSQKTIPAGFLIADGRSLKKAEYTELFDVIGYTYGGSGENFNLPNFADGKFMRSIGGNAAGLGVVQQDAIDVNSLQLRSIVTDSLGNRNVYGTTGNDYRAVQYTYSNTGTDIAYKSVAGKEDKPIFATSKPANENRPLNMSVVVLIKAKDVISPSAGQIDKSIIATEAKAGVVKLKNSITAQQEDAAVTEKAVSDLLDINKSIGVGQAYQDVWAQRELNTYYPNTTDRPIMVDFNLESTSGSYIFHIVVDDVVVRKIQSEQLYFVDAQFIVPAGSKYKIATPENTALKKLSICNNTNISSSWSELK